MNLLSCPGCGVVIDLSQKEDLIEQRIEAANQYDGSLNTDYVSWTDEGFVLDYPCPVCNTNIPTERRVLY